MVTEAFIVTYIPTLTHSAFVHHTFYSKAVGLHEKDKCIVDIYIHLIFMENRKSVINKVYNITLTV